MRRALAVLLVAAAGCGTFRAGEATVAQSQTIRIQLVRYYENVPFDYTGYKYDIECVSPLARTTLGASTEFADFNDNGPEALAAHMRKRITITPDDVVIWIQPWSIVFAFDGCRALRAWWPPRELSIDHPRFRDVHAGRGGAIAFIVESDGGRALRVTSGDAGAHWTYEPMK